MSTSDLEQVEEGYAGPAHLVAGDQEVAVEVRVRGFFQPIDGRFHWYGRVVASPEVDALVASGATTALRTPHGEATGRLSDQDPWGRYRIGGTGTPPFPTEAPARD